MIKGSDAMRCHFAIDSCEPSEDDVIIHEQCILLHTPNSKMARFERIQG